MKGHVNSKSVKMWNTARFGFLLHFFSITVLVLSWNIFQPPFASVDEAAHASRAYAAVHGKLFFPSNNNSPIGEVESVSAPRWILPIDANESPYCFWTKRSITADCGIDKWSDGTIIERPNATAQYFPTFYAVSGLPSLFLEGKTAYYAMRLIGSLFFLSILALTFFILYKFYPKRILTVIYIALTPITFLGAGTLTPNPIEVISSMTLALLINVFLDGERRNCLSSNDLRFMYFCIPLVQFLLLTSRPSGLVWSLLIWMVFLTNNLRMAKIQNSLFKNRLLLQLIVIQHVIAAIFLYFHRPKVAINLYGPQYDVIHAISFGLQNLVEQFRGLVGIIGMDVYLPEFAYAACLGFLGYLCITFFCDLEKRVLRFSRYIVGFLFFLLCSIATFADYYYRNIFTHMWQGRYSAPLYALFVLFLVLYIPRDSALVLISTLMMMINAIGMILAYIRYSQGFTNAECCGVYAPNSVVAKWLPFGMGLPQLISLMLLMVSSAFFGLVIATKRENVGEKNGSPQI